MRLAPSLLVLAALAAAASPVLAQTAPPAAGERPRFDPAPWWMRDPIIASSGYVELKIPANRASFSASFQAVQKTAAEATAAATAQVRELTAALAKFGADKARVETSLGITPSTISTGTRTAT